MDDFSIGRATATMRRIFAETEERKRVLRDQGFFDDKAVRACAGYLYASNNATTSSDTTDDTLRDPLFWEGIRKCLDEGVVPVDGAMDEVLIRPVYMALARLNDRECTAILTTTFWEQLLDYGQRTETMNIEVALEIAAALFVRRGLCDQVAPAVAERIRVAATDLDDSRLGPFLPDRETQTRMRRERSPGRSGVTARPDAHTPAD